MQPIPTLFVPKSTGTYADILEAFGLAALVREIERQVQPAPTARLIDAGPTYEVRLASPLRPDDVAGVDFFMPIPFIASGTTQPDDDQQNIPVRHVDDEWERFNAYREQRRRLREETDLLGEELRRALEDHEPADDWALITYVGDYRMQALNTYSSLVSNWWLLRPVFPQALVWMLEWYATPTRDPRAARRRWRAHFKFEGLRDRLTASQMFNPHQGKGQNQVKANRRRLSNQKVFWLPEFLKAVGLLEAAVPRTVTGADVRKTYVLRPRNLAIAHHRRIMAEFRRRLWNQRAITLDITATLLYTQTLLDYIEVEEQELWFEDETPALEDIVDGVNVVTYQALSANAYTMMNRAALGLPRWIGAVPAVRDERARRRLHAIIEDHLGAVRAIDETESEGYSLLRRYRDHLSSGDLFDFLDFAGRYGAYVVRRLARNRYARPLSEDNMRSMLMTHDDKLGPILDDQGFRNVAEAIRRSTIVPQYIGRRDSLYRIRYGLGQDLVRKSHYADEFLTTLSEFMASYNAENARIQEQRGEQRRRNLTTEDIDRIVALVDTHGPDLIAGLLVAYGYARDTNRSPDEEQPDEDAIRNT